MGLSETGQLWLTAVLSGIFAGLVAILVTVAIERTGGLVERAGPRGAHPRTLGQHALATRVLAALDALRKTRDT